MFDALQLVRERSDVPAASYGERAMYEVDPVDLYGETVAFLKENAAQIRAILALDESSRFRRALSGDGLAKFVVQGMRTAQDTAAIPDENWNLALMPFNADLAAGVRASRAQALEQARLFFTEVLHQQLDGAAIGLRITKDESYKL